MSPDLPAALRVAIDWELEGAPRRDLAERAARTSAAYRAGGTSREAIRDGKDALAYALARLPATYAACAAAFAEAVRAAPGFRPHSLLDAGAGAAGASWAALEAWPTVAAVSWLDASVPFLDLAGRLAEGGPPSLAGAERRRVDLTGPGPWPQADLVAG
ncbi:MAG: small ribosomal subunit Rsm22 family protein, partial [Phenylobacterium sp.]